MTLWYTCSVEEDQWRYDSKYPPDYDKLPGRKKSNDKKKKKAEQQQYKGCDDSALAPTALFMLYVLFIYLFIHLFIYLFIHYFIWFDLFIHFLKGVGVGYLSHSLTCFCLSSL